MEKKKISVKIFPKSPKHLTNRLLLKNKIKIKEDVPRYHLKYTFLNSVLNEEVYVHPPLGFEVEGQGKKVYKLNKTLYDLKQVPRDLNDIIDHYILNDGYKNNNEPSLYIEGN